MWDHTPLSCAAQAGRSDIVDYLLSIDVPTKGYKDIEVGISIVELYYGRRIGMM